MKPLNIPQIQTQKQFVNKEQERQYCFYAYPVLVCYDVQQKLPIPLQNVQYNLKVLKGMTCVQIEQTYSTMDYDKPIDLEYLFVINRNAAVTKMMVKLGDKKVIGIIKEKEEAKQEYKEGIKQGKTMAYCEQDDSFPEVKRIKLGQMAPQKQLKITFEYIQPLEVVFNRFWKIEISPLIHENYVIQKGNQRLFRYLKDIVDLRNSKNNYTQDFKINIDTGSKITFVKSPTHSLQNNAVKDQLENSQILQISLDGNPENYRPNKQFTILFSTEDINIPSAILSHINNDALQNQKYCATLTFVPKFNEIPLDDAYKQYLDKLNFGQNKKINRGNYLFIIDRSGSMGGDRIEKAKEALVLFLKSLPEDSQFNIISFGSQHSQLWNESKPYNQQTLDEAVLHVKTMQSNYGGTEIRDTLLQVVYTQNYAKQKNQTLNVFLLTDGEDTPQPIIDLVQNNNKPETRVYTIGIGEGCNQYLIKRIAEVGNGKCQFVSDTNEISEKVIDLLEDSITSYLEQFTLDCNVNGIKSIIPNPDTIVSLKKNQQLTLQILFSAEQSQENLQFQIKCFDPQEQKQISYSVNFNIKDSKENEYFHKLAIYKYITFYEDALRNGDKKLNEIKDINDLISQSDLVNVSIEHQILCSQTAFVCEVCDVEDQFKQQKREKIIINKKVEQKFSEYDVQQRFKPQRQMLFCMDDSPPGSPPHISMQMAGRCMPPPPPPTFAQKSPIGMNLKLVTNMLEPNFSQQCFLPSQNICSMPPPFQPQMLLMSMPTQEKSMPLPHMAQQCISKSKKLKIESDQPYSIHVMTHIEIMQFAQADGSFVFTDNALKDLQSDQLENKKNLSLNIWNTILALLYLEIKCNQERATWQLVYSKAIQFLMKNGIDYQEQKKDYMVKYRSILEKGI